MALWAGALAAIATSWSARRPEAQAEERRTCGFWILGDASVLDAGLATDTTSSNIIQALNEPLVNFRSAASAEGHGSAAAQSGIRRGRSLRSSSATTCAGPTGSR